MTASVRIADDLELPLDVATQSLGIVAQRGAGKTYLAAVLIEELVNAGVPVVALDPVGVLWGLRLGADGKERGGLPVVILGGERGDVPLDAGAGRFVAEWVVGERRSCVLDLSSFRKGEQRQFVTDFAEELYRKNREPLHVVLDEADSFIPQRPMHGEERMLGAFEDLVRRGRARGIGLTMATQRPAVIAKDCLTQVSTLVALRLVGPQDVKAIDAWIQSHGSAEDRKRVLDTLPGLPIGQAWFWSPGWLGILKRVKVRKRQTYDSSKAPSVGERRASPTELAPVDLEALKGKLAAAVTRAKADDPRVLKQRIAELDRQLKAKAAPPEQKIEQVEVPVIRKGEIADLEVLRDDFTRLAEKLHGFGAALGDALQTARALVHTHVLPPQGKRATAMNVTGTQTGRVSSRVPNRAATPRTLPQTNGESLPKGERAVLIAVAQHADGVTREQITILTGYKRSTRDAYVQRLREKGYIDDGGAVINVTSEGTKALGNDYEPLPTGDALLDYWRNRLPEGERKVLDVIIEYHPRGVDRDTIDTATGYARSSRDAYIRRLRNRKLVNTSGGAVTASEVLFG